MDWLVEVQIQSKLLQGTLFLTIITIDRFLSVEGKDVHRSRLQLVGVAGMVLISKIEEVIVIDLKFSLNCLLANHYR